MGVHRIVRFLSLMVFVIILGGCAVGITRVKLEHDPLNPVAQKREGTILVKEFKDIRTQEKSYIGNKRNMFGMVLGHIGPEENVRLTKVITDISLKHFSRLVIKLKSCRKISRRVRRGK